MSSKIRKFITRFTLLFIGLSLLSISGLYVFMQATIPDDTALIQLRNDITIQKNKHGVPYINAQTPDDAAFALGYVHAQDRLFQMDMMRRYASGRLSEIYGKKTLDTDRYMRNFRFLDRARDDFEHLSPHLKTALQAYADGVNHYMTNKKEYYAPEFYILGFRPEPWHALDCLLWQKNMALLLSHNWKHDLMRGRMSKILTIDQLKALWPKTSDEGPITIPSGDKMTTLVPRDLDELSRQRNRESWNPWSTFTSSKTTSETHQDHPTIASNAWIVDGAHSLTGKPILANDPHLKLSQPGPWYLARINLPERALVGATAPGLPFIVLGHNSRVAWGCTTTMGDVQDIFVEKFDLDNPGAYHTVDGFKSFTTFTETIKVKGEPDVTLTVRETHHGVILNDVIEPMPEDTVGELYALAWTGLTPKDKTAEAVYGMNFANDAQEFTQVLKNFHAPQQNIHYADINGNIGFCAPARLPIRKQGRARLPVAGWTGEYDWIGEVPFEGLPQTMNPGTGIIANANNKVVPDTHPYYIAEDYDNPPLRAIRLQQLLSAREKFTLGDMKKFQLDTLNLLHKEWHPYIQEIEVTNDRLKQLKTMLHDFDGIMDKNKPEPLIFEAWSKYLHQLTLTEHVGPYAKDYLMWKPVSVREILSLGQTHCANTMPDIQKKCVEKISAALVKTDELLTAKYGPDISAWRWGTAHQARFDHPVLGQIPGVKNYANRAIPTSGNRYTLNEAGTYLMPIDQFTHMNGPAFRGVYDLSDLNNTAFMITPGQSGHFMSPHYHDLVSIWERGDYINLGAECER